MLKRNVIGVVLVGLVAACAVGCESGDDGGEETLAQEDAGADVAAGDAASDSTDDPDGSSGDSGADTGSEPQLLGIDSLDYVGAFRVPAGEFGDSSMNYSQGPIAYDARDHSVFVVGHSHHQAIAQFSVPEIVDSTTVSELEMAGEPVQAFSGVLGRLDNPQAIDRIGGMALIEGANGFELLVNAYEYYDAPGDNTHTSLVVRDPADLAGSAVDGFFELDGRAHTSGWISPIPPEWRDELGGTHITGHSSGVPIISRLSVGPTAFAFDPLDVVGADSTGGPVETTALLDFSLENKLHEDLSNDTLENELWNHLSRATYGFIAPGTRTYVTLGSSGGHSSKVCYKCTQQGEDQPCGGYCAEDPSDYATYYWLWDVEDLVAVRRGEMQPHEVRPYEYGEFDIPFESNAIGGGSYDPASNRLYLTAQRADREQGQYANPPVVMVYEVQAP